MNTQGPWAGPPAVDHLDVIIVDDEPAGRRILREYTAREPDLRIVGEYGDTEIALHAIRQLTPDILLLDIMMSPMSGIDLVRQLDPQSTPLVVYLTAYDRFALEAFEVSAVDYMVKPFNEERFHKAIDRVRHRHATETMTQRHSAMIDAIERLEASTQALRCLRPRIIAEAGGRMHVLDVCQIEMVEADRNYIKLIVGDCVYTSRSTLQNAQESLRSQPMIRVSRSRLVNMSHIREISRTPRGDVILLLGGGFTVTSSERFRESVRKQLDQMQISLRRV